VKNSRRKFLLLFKFAAACCRVNISFLLLTAIALIAVAASPAQARYASMVVDADTGEVLQAVNADQRNYPASLTKIMTLYLLFDELDSGQVHLTDRMPISPHAAAQSPSKVGLVPGQTLLVEDAILAIVTKSANDVAVCIAEFLGGTESGFAERMTRKARELGMRETQFRNASGLPNLGQTSSARDMVTLARAIIHNHAKDYHYFSTRQFTYNGMVINTHNHLMEHYQGADGLKTGYIAASGFNLVASAKRNGRRLVGVIFGGQTIASRDHHMAQLLDAAFARPAGSAGVQMADLPEQKEEADAAEVTPVAKAPAADYRMVMKAMAAARAGQVPVTAKPQRTHTAKAASDDTAAGDSEDAWGIQVGAYSQQAKARQAAQAALHKLGKLVEDGEVSVVHGKGHHRIYRARVIGLPEDTAHEACRRLAKLHTACQVVNAGVNVAAR
jgi:D-alanyl-D-alanine carboxypeptidase